MNTPSFQTPFLLMLLLLLAIRPAAVTAQNGNPNKSSGWNDRPNKGRVRLSFAEAVESGKPAKDRKPLEDRRYSVSSPDNSRKLEYTYDYSLPTLMMNGRTSGGQAGVKTFQFPVDDGFTSHGFFVDNQGAVFAIQTDADDALYLIRFQPGTEESQVLEVGPSGGRRNRFIPYFGSGGQVYVGNVTENQAGELTGVMVSVFDFAADRVEEVQFHPLSPDLRKKMSSRLPEGRYDLVRFEVAPNGDRVLELEKRHIAANTYRYDPFAVHHPDQWQPRKQQVQTGGKIIFRLNQEGRMLSEEMK